MKALSITLAILALLFATPTEARKAVHTLADECNVSMPCVGGYYTTNAKRFMNSPFGSPRQSYKSEASILNHPAGCPGRAFCGCGASVRIFGKPVRSLYLAANWFRFPKANPAPGMAAVRRHHVFVMERHISGNIWLAYDANSGGHRTRLHARSLAGYTVVNPHG
jgi:hypothetical protein